MLAIFASLSMPFAVQADDKQPVKLPPVIMGYLDFPPLMWDENGSPKGELIDLSKEIAKEQGFDLHFIMRPVNRLYKDVADGKVHVWIGSPDTSTIAGKVLYKAPAVVVAELRLWARKGTDIPALDDLIQQPILVRRGYKYGGKFDDLVDPARSLKLIAASSHEDLFDLLRAGRAAYALDYKRPATEVYSTAKMQQFHSRLVEGYPSYFNVSKKAPNAEAILDAFHRGLLIARGDSDPSKVQSAR